MRKGPSWFRIGSIHITDKRRGNCTSLGIVNMFINIQFQNDFIIFLFLGLKYESKSLQCFRKWVQCTPLSLSVYCPPPLPTCSFTDECEHSAHPWVWMCTVGLPFQPAASQINGSKGVWGSSWIAFQYIKSCHVLLKCFVYQTSKDCKQAKFCVQSVLSFQVIGYRMTERNSLIHFLLSFKEQD